MLRPILLVASDSTVGDLLLGTFVEKILLERPLLAYVPDPADPQLTRRFAARPVQFLPRASPPENFDPWESRAFSSAASGRWAKVQRLLGRLYWFEPEGRPHWPGPEDRPRLWGWVETFVRRRVRAWATTRDWRRQLETFWPIAVLVCREPNPHPQHLAAEQALFEAATELEIPSGLFLPVALGSEEPPGYLPRGPARYWLTSQPRQRAVVAQHAPWVGKRCRVVGAPHFDFHYRQDLRRSREAYAAALGLDPQRPWILLAAAADTDARERLAGLVSALALAEPTLQWLVRLEPADLEPDWTPWRQALAAAGVALAYADTRAEGLQEVGSRVGNRECNRGKVWSPWERQRMAVDDLYHAAVVVHSPSTLAVDAALLDRPTLLWQDPSWSSSASPATTGVAPLLAQGLLRAASDLASCLAALQAYVADPRLDAENRRRWAALVTTAPSGGAGFSLASELLELAGEAA